MVTNIKKLLITGGSGLVGNSFKRAFPDAQYPTSKELDLTDKHSTVEYFKNHEITAVIHLAGMVGGVKANTEKMFDFYNVNSSMNNNLLEACVKNNIQKVVCCLSTCIYPDEKWVSYPLIESQLNAGPPHESNFGYAYAKRMMQIQLDAIRQQYKLNYISVIPNNIYGPNDNFDLENGHVIPALIRKIWEAKLLNKPTFEVWGDGEIFREFTYVDDIRDTIVFCFNNYTGTKPLNIGSSTEYKLKEVIEQICTNLGYTGNIRYDSSKPKGQTRKPSSNKSFLEIGWDPTQYTSLNSGLMDTCKWFTSNYPIVRGVK